LPYAVKGGCGSCHICVILNSISGICRHVRLYSEIPSKLFSKGYVESILHKW